MASLTAAVALRTRCCTAPPLEEEHLFVLVGDPGKVRAVANWEEGGVGSQRHFCETSCSPYPAPPRPIWLERTHGCAPHHVLAPVRACT